LEQFIKSLVAIVVAKVFAGLIIFGIKKAGYYLKPTFAKNVVIS